MLKLIDKKFFTIFEISRRMHIIMFYRDFEADLEDAEMERRGSLSSMASTATSGTSDSSSSGGDRVSKVGKYRNGKNSLPVSGDNFYMELFAFQCSGPA